MPTDSDLRQEIMSKLNFQDFYERHLGTKLVQDTHDGYCKRILCPIHKDVNDPQFFVNIVTGRFKCFACNESGTPFDLLMKLEGLSFKDALVKLANEAGVVIPAWKEAWKKKYGESGPPQSAPLDETEVFTVESEDIIPKENTTRNYDVKNPALEFALIQKMQADIRPHQVRYLVEKRGLNQKMIERAMIGVDENARVKIKDTDNEWTCRFSLPVFNEKNDLRNIRLYSPHVEKPYPKMINYTVGKKGTPQYKGFGKPARLYPLHWLIEEQWDNIIYCEGEWDALLLNQKFKEMNLATWGALTNTHGVNTFLAEWLEYFIGRNVYICLDKDARSTPRAHEIATQYFLPLLKDGRIPLLKIIDLPLAGTKDDKDITDFFVQHHKKPEDFISLCTRAEPVISGGISSDDASRKPIDVPDFVQAIKDRRFIDQRVRVPITIVGTTSKVYHATRDYKVIDCPYREDQECCQQDGPERFIPYGHPLFIDSCMTRPEIIDKRIAQIACTKPSCDVKCKIKATRKVVMEEYIATQVVKRWRSEEIGDGTLRSCQELTQALVYILQPPENMSIEPTNYIATGYIRTHPNTSVATFFIEEMQLIEEDWKKFTVERSEDNQKILRKLASDFTTDDLVDQITNGVTHIYDSDDLLYGMLLSYLTPLWFKFNGRIQRGWMNVAIVGDTGTGKSAIYQRLSDWLDVGDLFSTLSGSRTGLLYAIKTRGNDWQVQIGRYVMASGRIIMIDEADKAEPDDLRQMGIAMHEGFLQINRVASGGYRTEVRGIFAMNPKQNGEATTISNFAYGCDILPEIFDPMMIRRFDLAIFVMGRNSPEMFNKQYQETPIRLTSKMFRTLVYWAWTRKPSDIIWDEASTKQCLLRASEVSLKFGFADRVPLVNPNDFREKLARISVAYAVLDRSFSDDLQKLIVKPEHVDMMAKLYDMIYSASSCSLLQRSQHSRRTSALEEENYLLIRKELNEAIGQQRNDPYSAYYRNNNLLCQLIVLLQQVPELKRRDTIDHLGVNQKWLLNKIAFFMRHNLVEATASGFRPTRKFNLFMHRWTQEMGIQKMLDESHHLTAPAIEEEVEFENPFAEPMQ